MKRILSLIIFLCVTNAVHAVQYIYPTPTGGFTTFVIGNLLNGGTSDTLSLNGNGSIVPGEISGDYLFQTFGTGNVALNNLATNPVFIASRAASTSIKGGVIGNTGTFTVASGITLRAISGTAFAARGIEITNSSNSVINNGNIEGVITSGSGGVYGVDGQGTVTNNSNIYAYNDAGTTSALTLYSTSATSTNNGAIVASSGTGASSGVLLLNYTGFVNAASGSISSVSTNNQVSGIRVLNVSTITNNGNITSTYTGTGGAGYGLYLANNPNITVNNTGVISGTNYSIYVTNSTTTNINLNGGTLNGDIFKDGTGGTVNATFGNSATTIVNGAVSGVNLFTVNSGATAQLNGTLTVASTETASIGGSLTGTGNISNSGNMTITGTTSGTGSITNQNVSPGTINLSNGSNINSKTITNNRTLNINGASTNNASISNGVTGTINISANLSGSGAITNSNILTVSANSTVVNQITNDSSLSTAMTINTGVTLTYNAVSALTNNASKNINLVGSIAGTGAITNNGIFTWTGGAITSSGLLTNTSTFNVNETVNRSGGTTTNSAGTFTIANTKTFTNAGTFTLSGGSITSPGTGTFTHSSGIFAMSVGSLTGSVIFNNNSTFNYTGGTVDTTGLITNTSAFNVDESLSRSGPTTNSAGTFTIATTKTFTNSGAFTLNGGSITSAGTGTFTHNSGIFAMSAGSFTGSTIFNNNATFNYTGGTVDTSGLITNTSAFNVNENLSRSGPTTNSAGTFTIAAGKTFSNSGVFTLSGGSLVGGGGTGAFTNTGTLNVTSNVSNTAVLTNNNIMAISANISGAGNITNNGTVTVTGQRTLAAATYTSPGTQNFTITNDSTFDSIASSGAVNISNGTVNITSSFVGPLDVQSSWNILSGSSLTTNGATVINIPTSSMFTTWQKVVSSTNVTINYIRSTFVNTNLAEGELNQSIAAVLELMAEGTQNAAQTQLLNAVSATTTSEEYNQALNALVPNVNSVVPNITTQNQTMQKIEARIAALRDGINSTGFNAGNLTPDHSVWLSGFGSLTSQGPVDENAGYSAQTLGALLGFDTCYYDDNFGFALGISGSRVNEFSNQNYNTSTDGYHALNYGTHNMRHNNYFDWLFSGSYNRNYSNRPFAISGTNFSTTASYHSYLGAAKLVRGKAYDFWDHYRFTPLTSIQYTYVNQQAYNETGSAAALHVAEQSKNILTLGVGTKFAYPIDNNAWKMIGMRELRIIGTYDALSSNDETTASFVAGSSDFNVVNTPGRWGLRFGASITFEMAKCLHLLLNYDLDLRKKFADNTLLAKIRFIF